MSANGDHVGFPPEHIDELGCRQLLAAVGVGRLAVCDGDAPLIVVLNHACDSDDVVFRTSQRSALARLTANDRQPAAVFEVDSAFPPGRSGWSVIAHGWLRRELDPDRAERVRARLAPWAVGERDLVLRLKVAEVTGRRAGHTPSFPVSAIGVPGRHED